MIQGSYFIGVDPAQSHDFTAIAVVERAELQGEWDGVAWAHRKETALRLRHLERAPLGTPYTEIVERMRAVARRPELAGRCRMVLDATGVGAPVLDMLRVADPGCKVWPVLITGGELEREEGGHWRVPKRDLIVGLQVLLEQGELQIASGLALGEALVEEMSEMRVRVTAAGREQFGVWCEGKHDDLVLAVSLACWGVGKVYPRGRMRDEDRYWLGRRF